MYDVEWTYFVLVKPKFNVSKEHVLFVYPKPKICYSSIVVGKTFKNTSVSHFAALGDMFLHLHEHTHTLYVF